MGTQLSEKLFNDLLLTRAMEKNIGKLERWGSLNEIIDELFADGALDRDEYFSSLLELTQLGYVASGLKIKEDIKKSEKDGYNIECVTEKGLHYIDSIMREEVMKEKVLTFFGKVDEVCGAVAESDIFKLSVGIAGIVSLFSN